MWSNKRTYDGKNFFSLALLDLSDFLFIFLLFQQKDNYNQLVTISSVDGDTFIIDRHSNIIRFRPPLSSSINGLSENDSVANTSSFEQIQAFTSGLFGDNNAFCFVYVLTHNDKIIIVHSTWQQVIFQTISEIIFK